MKVNLTERQLSDIEFALPEIYGDIRDQLLAASVPKGQSVAVMIACRGDKKMEVIGMKLSDHWAITPHIGHDDKPRRSKRELTHIDFGHNANKYSTSRRKILAAWAKLSDETKEAIDTADVSEIVNVEEFKTAMKELK